MLNSENMKNYQQDILLKNIKSNLEEIRNLLELIKSHWVYEDHVYRFYHQSYEIFPLQKITEDIVNLLRSLATEGCTINRFFDEIFKEGTGVMFEDSYNKNWTQKTRPIVEAFLHAKFFLEMAFKYGSELVKAPEILPSGWAALLYFYNLR